MPQISRAALRIITDTPSVMVIWMNIGLRRAGARVSRSCAMPSSAPTATAARMANGSGVPSAVRLAATRPPIMTNSPWAKLTTPETLAHRTKPSATRA